MRFGFPRQRPQRLAEIAQYAHFDDIVLVDLGGGGVDMHDGLATVGVPLFRMIFDHVVADADHHVGFLEPKGHQVFGLEPHGAKRQFMGKREGALGHERGRHRDAQHFGKAH